VILTKLEWSRGSGSDRQLADARGIIQIQATSLDWPYLEKWADELGIRDLLEEARHSAGLRST